MGQHPFPNTGGLNDDETVPEIRLCSKQPLSSRGDKLRSRRQAKQNNSAVCGKAEPKSELSKIFVQSQQHSRLANAPFQNFFILHRGSSLLYPSDIMAKLAESFDGKSGKVLVCQESHQAESG